MNNSYFLDTSFSIALAISKDAFHAKAKQLSKHVASQNIEIVTTVAILLEIGNSLSKARFRPHAVEVLNRLRSEPFVNVVEITDDLVNTAFALFQSRMDKNWSLVDCISFVVMENLNIESALTTDTHFVQAGFRALLRED